MLTLTSANKESTAQSEWVEGKQWVPHPHYGILNTFTQLFQCCYMHLISLSKVGQCHTPMKSPESSLLNISNRPMVVKAYIT